MNFKREYVNDGKYLYYIMILLFLILLVANVFGSKLFVNIILVSVLFMIFRRYRKTQENAIISIGLSEKTMEFIFNSGRVKNISLDELYKCIMAHL